MKSHQLPSCRSLRNTLYLTQGTLPGRPLQLGCCGQQNQIPRCKSHISHSVQAHERKEKMKMFAHNCIPRQVDTDNGLPLNSKESSEFAKQERFKHHRIPTLHPRANGKQRFMQLLNKTEQIIDLQEKDEPERNVASPRYVDSLPGHTTPSNWCNTVPIHNQQENQDQARLHNPNRPKQAKLTGQTDGQAEQ